MIKQHGRYKVALVGDCLAGGGAERVHARLSEFFSSQGIEVYNCIFADRVEYPYSGSLFNLGKIGSGSSSPRRKIQRFTAFRKFMTGTDFDAVIDFRMRTSALQELLLSKFAYGSGVIYSIRSGHLDFYFPKPRLLSRFIYRDKKINTVTDAIAKVILQQNLGNTVNVIYNPINFSEIGKLAGSSAFISGGYILAAGRMNDGIKQFDQLISAYSKTSLASRSIRLVIIGDGGNMHQYVRFATSLGMGDMVEFAGFVSNPYPYYKSAIATVLCSRNEGFPNVLAESLACGTPVISFDCFSGPSEIISHGNNGLLVADQDFEALTAAMELMVTDSELHKRCKDNSIESVRHLSIENIGQQWLDYLNFT